jgi:hypothetical protein
MDGTRMKELTPGYDDPWTRKRAFPSTACCQTRQQFTSCGNADMSPEKQLEAIVKGKVRDAVQQYLGGDWSRLPSLFTIPRSMFDSWADSIELPYGRVSRTRSADDGVYVLPDADGWLVFEQERGAHLPGERVYENYRQAKRAALRLEFLRPLRGVI